MKDSQLKDALFKHYWKQRCFVQPEVAIYCNEGVSGLKKPITDVDIFALRPMPDLSFARVLGDCKTLKGQSPINRSLWLSGLIGFLDAASGCVLLDGDYIEPDHKLAAYRMNVLLLNRKDFCVYDRSINFPDGSEAVEVGLSDIAKLCSIQQKFPRVSSLTSYLYRDAFREQTFGTLIRHSISNVRSVAAELDPEKTEHLALLCDAAAIFSIGVAQCCGTLFHQYLHPADKGHLSESLKVLIYGGKDQYELNRILRSKLLAAQGKNTETANDLELPEWNCFLQLTRNILERPADAFKVPWLLRHLAFDLLSSRKPLASAIVDDLLAVKYAMLVVEYICRASGVPKPFQEKLVSMTVRVQSDLAVLRDQKIAVSVQLNETMPIEDPTMTHGAEKLPAMSAEQEKNPDVTQTGGENRIDAAPEFPSLRV